MKNLKIGVKISLGFLCMFVLLSLIAVTSISSSSYTVGNVREIEIYDGLQSNANDLMHILNESRITAESLYAAYSSETFANINKQLLYCDYRLSKLYEYIADYPELADFNSKIKSFEGFYAQWREGIISMNADYNLGEEMSEADLESFFALAGDMRRTNLLAHETLSNTILDMSYVADRKIQDTKSFSMTALGIAAIISVVSLFAAIALATVIMRSITVPMGLMREVLADIGQHGDLLIPEERLGNLRGVAEGKDETSQCVSALLTLVDRLNTVDKTLQSVSGGDLTVMIRLQSERDTMGLAVHKMLSNLNQKFDTISRSTNEVRIAAVELSDGSSLLADGSREQTESIEDLSNIVQRVNQKTVRNTEFAMEASELVGNIQENANNGTEKMNQMIQAAADINASSQSISKVIKLIDEIAFQTNILALNAAVEAARAGQFGKGFAVVAEEVRNLANKSTEAAKDTGILIEDTMRKAEMGSSIAEITSQSLEKIVEGVKQSNSIIGDMASLSREQAADINQITEDVSKMEAIVRQNSLIASQSAGSASKISDQANLLKELVEQFHLADTDM